MPFFEKIELEKQSRYNKYLEKLGSKYCCICERNGLETELLSSVYIRGLYCTECIDNESDGDGGLLIDHKFELL